MIKERSGINKKINIMKNQLFTFIALLLLYGTTFSQDSLFAIHTYTETTPIGNFTNYELVKVDFNSGDYQLFKELDRIQVFSQLILNTTDNSINFIGVPDPRVFPVDTIERLYSVDLITRNISSLALHIDRNAIGLVWNKMLNKYYYVGYNYLTGINNLFEINVQTSSVSQIGYNLPFINSVKSVDKHQNHILDPYNNYMYLFKYPNSFTLDRYIYTIDLNSGSLINQYTNNTNLDEMANMSFSEEDSCLYALELQNTSAELVKVDPVNWTTTSVSNNVVSNAGTALTYFINFSSSFTSNYCSDYTYTYRDVADDSYKIIRMNKNTGDYTESNDLYLGVPYFVENLSHFVDVLDKECGEYLNVKENKENSCSSEIIVNSNLQKVEIYSHQNWIEKVSVFDSSGKIILLETKLLTNSYTISLDRFKNGIYFIIIEGNGCIDYKKIPIVK